MTTEEDEPIVLVGSEGFRIELSPEARALVWNAVRRGLASSPQEYITAALDRWMAKQRLEEPQPEHTSHPEKGQQNESQGPATAVITGNAD